MYFCQNKIVFLNSAFPNIALQTLLLYLKYLVKHKKLKTNKDVKINCGMKEYEKKINDQQVNCQISIKSIILHTMQVLRYDNAESST